MIKYLSYREVIWILLLGIPFSFLGSIYILKFGGNFYPEPFILLWMILSYIFFNKKILKNDLSYKLQYKIYLQNPHLIKHINILIADFEGGGVSSLPSIQKRKDKYRIILKHYGYIGLIKAIFYRLGKNNFEN